MLSAQDGAPVLCSVIVSMVEAEEHEFLLSTARAYWPTIGVKDLVLEPDACF